MSAKQRKTSLKYRRYAHALSIVRERMVMREGVTFICEGVQSLEGDELSHQDVINLKAWILTQLGTHYTYRSWLSEHHPIVRIAYDKAHRGDTRLPWLDAMIAQLEQWAKEGE